VPWGSSSIKDWEFTDRVSKSQNFTKVILAVKNKASYLKLSGTTRFELDVTETTCFTVLPGL
jgi:hypothetical protein